MGERNTGMGEASEKILRRREAKTEGGLVIARPRRAYGVRHTILRALAKEEEVDI